MQALVSLNHSHYASAVDVEGGNQRIGRIQQEGGVVLDLDGDGEGSACNAKHSGTNNSTLGSRTGGSLGLALGIADAVERVIGAGNELRRRGVCGGLVGACEELEAVVPLRVGHIGYANVPAAFPGRVEGTWEKAHPGLRVVAPIPTAHQGQLRGKGYACARQIGDIRGWAVVGPRPEGWGGCGRC